MHPMTQAVVLNSTFSLDLSESYQVGLKLVRNDQFWPCSFSEDGISILSMGEVMKYLLEQNIPLVNQEDLLDYLNMSQTDWMNIADKVKGNFLVELRFRRKVELILILFRIYCYQPWHETKLSASWSTGQGENQKGLSDLPGDCSFWHSPTSTQLRRQRRVTNFSVLWKWIAYKYCFQVQSWVEGIRQAAPFDCQFSKAVFWGQA